MNKKHSERPQTAPPVVDPHPMGKERFDALVDLMTRGKKPSTAGTSSERPRAGYAGTRTRRGSSGGTCD